MPIPTPQPAGDNGTYPLSRALPSALTSRMAEEDLTCELEMEDDTNADEVWVLSIHIEFADAADSR